MGLSSKKTKTTSNETATTAPSAAYSPYIDTAAATLKPAYEAANANNQQLMGGIDKGLDYYGDVLDGKYLEGNPYLDDVISRSNEDITSGVASQFSTAGRYGSGYHAGVLADKLAGNENQLRYQNYATERQNQNAAPGGSASLTGISAALPQMASSQYSDQIAQLLGKYVTGTGSGTSTSKTSGGFLGDLLLASIAGATKAAGGGA